MKQIDQNRLTTWRAVRQYLDANIPIWSGNAPFVHASEMLTKAISGARTILSAQAGTSTGISTRKDAMENEAVRQTVAIARCAKILAMDTGNSELMAAVDYAKSRLQRLPQNELAARLRAIVHAAEGHSDELKQYGVRWEAYHRALDVIASMEGMQSSIRTTIKLKKAATEDVPVVISQGQQAIMRMTNLIHVFEAENPEFVSGFMAIRDVVHSGIRR